MNKKIGLMLALAIAFGAAQAAASGDAAKGKAKSAPCAACHGEDGNSKSGEFPRLAGQNPDYLYFALAQYKNKQRKNPIMGGFAATLKPEDMADLSAYYGSQKGLEYKY